MVPDGYSGGKNRWNGTSEMCLDPADVIPLKVRYLPGLNHLPARLAPWALTDLIDDTSDRIS